MNKLRYDPTKQKQRRRHSLVAQVLTFQQSCVGCITSQPESSLIVDDQSITITMPSQQTGRCKRRSYVHMVRDRQCPSQRLLGIWNNEGKTLKQHMETAGQKTCSRFKKQWEDNAVD